ncbi:MAG: hypothetical protein Kow00109_17260 [Acidobacteriota bacterium]
MGTSRRGRPRGAGVFLAGLLVTGLLWALTALRQPTADLRALEAKALTLQPPSEAGVFREPELVDLRRLDAGFRFDIRYATARNFLGVPVYSRPGAYLQRPAAAALVAAQRELERRGLGLLIFDAYRPWYVTWIFWQATPPHLREFVADPAGGSRHNRGCAVDLTLYDLRSGEPLPMPTDYDDFSPAAHIDYPGGDPVARANRDLLRSVMEGVGFEPYPPEWWHYDFREWRSYPILNLRFEELEQSGALPPGEARVDDP